MKLFGQMLNITGLNKPLHYCNHDFWMWKQFITHLNKEYHRSRAYNYEINIGIKDYRGLRREIVQLQIYSHLRDEVTRDDKKTVRALKVKA